MTLPAVFRSELEQILDCSRDDWERLRTARIFVTGGTGFVGKWLLSAFLHARERLGLQTELLVLTREPERFCLEAPHLAQATGIELLQGALEDFAFPRRPFTHVLHAAARVQGGQASDHRTGLERVLRLCEAHTVGKLLYVSSGAVYGVQPADRECLSENRDPGEPATEYARGKQQCEALLRQTGRLDYSIARCFAFLGPYLPPNAGYAAADFLRQAAQGQTVTVRGDGSAIRSYLYAADLALWLWTLLARGAPQSCYNVGAATPVCIAELAREIAEQCGVRVEIQGSNSTRTGARRYLPCTEKARTELGLQEHWTLSEAVATTLRWLRTTDWRG